MVGNTRELANSRPYPAADQRVIDTDLIGYVTRAIIEHFHPNRIILFGSQARGDARPNSDLDLLVEMETPLRPVDRMIAVDSIFGLRSWPMDIVVFTPEEARRLRATRGSFLSQIEAEGKLLYERP